METHDMMDLAAVKETGKSEFIVLLTRELYNVNMKIKKL